MRFKPLLYGLFCQENSNEPMVFTMAFGPKKEEIRDLIEKGGGVLLDPGENDEGAGLLLVDKDEMGEGRSLRTDKDMFDCSLIRDCVMANDLVPNMLEYRLNKKSRFGSYDPSEILLGNMKWSDVPLASPSSSTTNEEDEGDICSDFEEEGVERRKSSVTERRPTRMPYTRKNQEAILDYIVKMGLFNNLKGNDMWKSMEKSRVCPNRSWQSLKEHFRRQIMPQIGTYHLSPGDVRRFRRAFAGDRVLVLSDDDRGNNTVAPSSSTSSPRGTGRLQRSSFSSSSPDKSNVVRDRSPSKKMTQGPRTSSSSPAKSNVVRDRSPSKKITRSPRTSSYNPAKSNPVVRTRSPLKKTTDSPQRSSSFSCSSPDKSIDIHRSPSKSDPPTLQKSPVSAVTENDKRKHRLYKSTLSGRPILLTPPMSERSERYQRRRNATEEKQEENDPAVELPVEQMDKGGEENVFPRPGPSKRTRRISETSELSIRTFVDRMYSTEEDAALIAFVRDNGYIRAWKGRALWEEAERKKVVPGRTWQSMKQRFRKHIVKKTGLEYFIREGAEAKPVKASTYTDEQDREIIDYLLKNRAWMEVKGKGMWVGMEKRGVAGGRTWQSLKERFIKRIRPNIGRYEGISNADKQKLTF